MLFILAVALTLSPAVDAQPVAQPAPAQPAPAPAPVEAGAQPAQAPAPSAGDHAAAPAPAASAADSAHAPAQPTTAGHEPAAGSAAGGHESAEAHEESPWGLIARIFNFAVLVGLLAYYLRAPIARHLASRRQQIASDLVSARETSDRASRELNEIDRRVRELPAELEQLRVKGAEEVAAVGAKIREQAEAERHRLLDQTRREVEMQVRLAKKALAEHTADLAVQLAHDRVAATITPTEQDRLVDRYVSQVKEFHG